MSWPRWIQYFVEIFNPSKPRKKNAILPIIQNNTFHSNILKPAPKRFDNKVWEVYFYSQAHGAIWPTEFRGIQLLTPQDAKMEFLLTIVTSYELSLTRNKFLTVVNTTQIPSACCIHKIGYRQFRNIVTRNLKRIR